MKDNNEPQPGYLGQNLNGHKEPVPEMAWEGIEARLNRKKRRGLFFWIFGALGLLLAGFGWWELSRNTSELAVSSTQIVNNQHQEVIPKENSQLEKPGNKEKDQSSESRTDSGTKEEKATTSSSDGHTEKEEVLKESPNQKQPASGQKATKEFVFSKADQKGRQAVSVFTSEDALPGTSHTEIGPTTASGKEPKKKKTNRESSQPISTSALAMKQNQPNPIMEPKKEIQKDLLMDKPNSHSPEPEKLSEPVSSRTSSSIESTTEISPKTQSPQEKPNVVLNENQEDPNQSQSNSKESQISPSVVNAAKDSIPKQVAKTVARPDSLAVSKTDSTQPQKRKKQANWMLSFHAGLMMQNASLQQDYFRNEGLPMVAISPADVSKAPSFRLAMSRLWQLSRSLWLGIEVSANGIFQRASAILNPSEETPIRYEYGADSLSVVAVTGYQNLRQTYNRNTLVAGLYPRIQWKPERSPIGIQARFRVASFTHVLTGLKPTEAFEYSPQNWEIGLWAPISDRHQISIDCNRVSWNQSSLPVPVKNSGQNWILSVGYGWKW
jgi:hypothetical protein